MTYNSKYKFNTDDSNVEDNIFSLDIVGKPNNDHDGVLKRGFYLSVNRKRDSVYGTLDPDNALALGNALVNWANDAIAARPKPEVKPDLSKVSAVELVEELKRRISDVGLTS